VEAYIIDWLGLLGRWLHFVAGIAWVGASFYFVWLDNHLLPPKDPADRDQGVAGEVWSVHGGGFYHARKYALTPPELPETLHWFKWEAYATWLSGVFLLGLIYWYSAEVYLIDPQVMALGKATAVGLGVASMVLGWLVYDLMCRSPLGGNEKLLGACVFLFAAAAAWGLCQVFSGRGAFIHYGAMLGTIMVANVAFVIIPGQRELVAAAREGRTPDPSFGARGKQRSVHNTYFTLPVLFVMISNHYAMTYGHPYNWLILIALSLAGALIRVYFVMRHRGRAPLAPLIASVLIIVATAAAIAPSAPPTRAQSAPVDFERVQGIIDERCAGCHAESPTQPGFSAPPKGLVLETRAQIIANAAPIYRQTVESEVMPIGNLTGMTEAERRVIGNWYESEIESD